MTEKCFDLLFAFDEVRILVLFYFKVLTVYYPLKILTAGGYREPINLQQIRTNMEMDSHEEKLHNMIKLSKMESAKDQAQAAARAIKDKQREAKSGFGSGMGSNYGGDNDMSVSSSASPSFSSSSSSAPSLPVSTPSQPARNQPVKGMSLGAGPKTKAFEDALIKEDKLAPIMSSTSKSVSNTVETAPIAPVVQHPVMLAITEKVSAKISKDGLVEMLEIKGNLNLTAMNDDVANCTIKLKPIGNASEFSFNTHPKINKPLYDKSSILQLKDQSKGFPSGRPVGILKWTNSNSNEDMLPLKINCWPEEEGRGQMNVSIEYSMDLSNVELHDVKIHIPLGNSAQPNIVSVDGSHRYNSSQQELIWELDMIDRSNSTGSLEFNIQQKDSNAFFPIHVHFASKQLFCTVDVSEVVAMGTGAPIMYGLSKGMSSEEYTIA